MVTVVEKVLRPFLKEKYWQKNVKYKSKNGALGPLTDKYDII